MKRRLMFFLFAALTACIQKPPAPEAAKEPRAPYPFGKYQHQVRIQILKPEHHDFSVTGALSYAADEIKLIGLSPMGTTLFRLTDTKGSELKTEYFMDALAKADPFIRAFYGDLREALVTPDPRTKFTKNGTDFIFADLDEKKIPRLIFIANPKFEVTVKVVGYDP